MTRHSSLLLFLAAAAVITPFFVPRTATGATIPNPPPPTVDGGYPLSHPYDGCPAMHVWEGMSGCSGLKADLLIQDSWEIHRDFDSPLYLVHDGVSNFACSTSFDPATRSYADKKDVLAESPDGATCIYGHNYCPTLEPLSVNNATAQPCISLFKQISNSKWDSLPEADMAGTPSPYQLILDVEKSKRGPLTLSCHDGRDGTFLGDVITYKCHNDEQRIAPGLNLLRGKHVYFAATGVNMIDTEQLRGIEVTTPADASQWLLLWAGGIHHFPKLEGSVAMAQLYNKDNEEGIVQMKDVGETSLRMRVIRPQSCLNPSHKQDKVAVMLLRKSRWIIGNHGHFLEANLALVPTGPAGLRVRTLMTLDKSQDAFIMAQVQQNHLDAGKWNGPLDYYIRAQIGKRTYNPGEFLFDIKLETNQPVSKVPQGMSVRVGYMVMYTPSNTPSQNYSSKYKLHPDMVETNDSTSSILQMNTSGLRHTFDQTLNPTAKPLVFATVRDVDAAGTSDLLPSVRVNHVNPSDLSLVFSGPICTGTLKSDWYDVSLLVVKFPPPTGSS